MLCQVCKVNDATVRYTEIVNNSVTEIHLCEKCAQFEDKTIGSEISFSGMFTAPDQADEAGVTEADVAEKCSSCGHTLGDIMAGGRVGCAECYTTFASQLAPLIKKVHGAVQHVGKVPTAKGEGLKLRTELLRYRGRLRDAIEVENYEEAARLRDLIRDIEQKMVGG